MAYNVSITVSLDLERDRDIMAWLERQENRSAAVRKVLRAYIQDSPTLGDLHRLLKHVDRQIGAGAMLVSTGCKPAEDHVESIAPRFVAALEQLSEQSC